SPVGLSGASSAGPTVGRSGATRPSVISRPAGGGPRSTIDWRRGSLSGPPRGWGRRAPVCQESPRTVEARRVCLHSQPAVVDSIGSCGRGHDDGEVIRVRPLDTPCPRRGWDERTRFRSRSGVSAEAWYRADTLLDL